MKDWCVAVEKGRDGEKESETEGKNEREKVNWKIGQYMERIKVLSVSPRFAEIRQEAGFPFLWNKKLLIYFLIPLSIVPGLSLRLLILGFEAKKLRTTGILF